MQGAYKEYKDTVTNIGKALDMEEEVFIKRAGQLKEGSKRAFKKVNPAAVARLHCSDDDEEDGDDEDEEEEDKDEEDIDSYISVYKILTTDRSRKQSYIYQNRDILSCLTTISPK